MDFLLGLSENKNKKIKDDNLLNFYLSSITFKILNMNQIIKQIQSIWEYMNSANLISLSDINDKEKIKKY